MYHEVTVLKVIVQGKVRTTGVSVGTGIRYVENRGARINYALIFGAQVAVSPAQFIISK